jgi:hypothetical protein
MLPGPPMDEESAVLLGTYILMPWVMMIGSKAKAWQRMPAQVEDATS